MKKPTIRPTHRHTFRFKLDNGVIIEAKAKVRAAKKAVTLVLTKGHIKEAIKNEGQGNTMKCAMAVCSRAHGDAFPHPFHFVDWLYNRAYFVTRVHPETKLPAECVVYTHHDNIAPNFDTMAGMRKLLKSMENAEGERTIRLYPPKVYRKAAGRPRGQNTGERQRTIRARGAALRFARAIMGAAPAA
jgi:hypothetical protein